MTVAYAWYMRRFAEVWPDRAIVQRSVAQLPWRHNIARLEKLATMDDRAWYARNVQKFLLEMGAGFAFVGRQVHLEFSSADYYLDLLFCHLKLRCYVVGGTW